MINALWRDRRGATAITLGILAVPIILGVGLCVDYAAMARDRAVVQGIADRALLAAALVPSASDSDITAAVKSYVDGEKATKVISGIDSMAVSFPAPDRIHMKIHAHTRTTVMNMVADRIGFVVTSEALRGLSGELEVAIALDTTGSMGAGGKLDAAKSAAKELVDSLSGKDLGATVKFSLVPFATYVKVGTDQSGQPWLDVPPDSAPEMIDDYANCPTVVANWYDDGVLKTSKKDCSATPKISKVHTWQGCVGSRSGELQYEAGGDASSKIPGLLKVGCPRTLLPLTDSLDTVKAEINSLSASSETYIPAGLLWGFNMLTPGAPMSKAAGFDPEGLNTRPHKALVLMTDGENTRSAAPPTHNGSDKALANNATKKICDNVKAKKIELYTIAFQVTDGTTKSMLEECATDASFYYDAANSTALLDAFKDIAKTLKKVRLAR